MDHEEIKSLLPLAALDRLEPAEAAILEEHLRTCDECPAELQAYRDAAAAIPLADEPAAPHDRIWARLEARLAAEDHATGASSRAATTAADRPRRPTARGATGWRIATGLAAAAAIVIAIYAGLLTNQLHQQDTNVRAQVSILRAQITDLRSAVSEARVRMAELQNRLVNRERMQQVLLTRDVTLTRLAPLPAAPNASAIVAVSSSSRTAALEARGLPPTPPGKVYELWWITKENGPVPAGLFAAPDSGALSASVAAPPAGQHVLLSAVTLEPLPGVPKPTGAMYLKGAPG
ncbi:MAG TPA: anti-sigma factor [Candidatus Binataceae bacterium]|nr:anti-sigma factor [Candidatus Binataceae bacterium]